MELMPKSRGFTTFSLHKRGFTLVELLVVISIIAILSTVGMALYGTASKSGRVSRRIQDLKATQTALELYYNATTPKAYPITFTSTNPVVWTAIPAALVPVYMPAIPTDPDSENGIYDYASNGTDYKLRARGATEMTPDDYKTQPNLIDPEKDGGDCSKVEDDGIPAGWAISSSNTGDNNNPPIDPPTNPACW